MPRRRRRKVQPKRRNVTKASTSTTGSQNGQSRGQGSSSSSVPSHRMEGMPDWSFLDTLGVSDQAKVLSELYRYENLLTAELEKLKLEKILELCDSSDSEESDNGCCHRCANQLNNSDLLSAKDVVVGKLNHFVQSAAFMLYADDFDFFYGDEENYTIVLLVEDVPNLGINPLDNCVVIGDLAFLDGNAVLKSAYVTNENSEPILDESDENDSLLVVDSEDLAILVEEPEKSVLDEVDYTDNSDDKNVGNNTAENTTCLDKDTDYQQLDEVSEVADELAAQAHSEEENVSPVIETSELLKKDAELRKMLVDEEEKEKMILERCKVHKSENKMKVFSPIGVCWSDYTQLFEDETLIGNTKCLGNLLASKFNKGKKNVGITSFLSQLGQSTCYEENGIETEDCLDPKNSCDSTVATASDTVGEDVTRTPLKKNGRKRLGIYNRFADFLVRRLGL